MTIKNSTSLHVSIAIVKAYWSQNFPSRPSKIGQKFLFFWKVVGLRLKFYFRDPKRHILARNDVI